MAAPYDLKKNRTKTLQWLVKQEFFKMEAKKDKSKCQYAERDIFQKHQNNPYQYAVEVSQWIFQRKLNLWQLQYDSMANNDANKLALRANIDHHKSRKAMIIQQKAQDLCNALDFPLSQVMNTIKPFMVYHHPHTSISYANTHAHAAIPQLRQQMINMKNMQMMNMNMNINLPQKPTATATSSISNAKFQPPPAKRAKLSHSNHNQSQNKAMSIPKPKPKVPQKTEEEIQNEKIEKVKIDRKLLIGKNLTKWLDERLEILKETQELTKILEKDKKKLAKRKGIYKSIRTDIDAMKCQILQNNGNSIGDNKDLKKIFYQMSLIEDHLPKLRQQHIIPMINKHSKVFQTCNIRQIINAQNEIKQILNDNQFKDKADIFCNVYGKEYIQCELFESKCNEILNDDLELLRDHGAKFMVEQLPQTHKPYTLQIKFKTNLDGEKYNNMIMPSLVIMINEKEYKHYYGMLPCFKKIKERFMDFNFSLDNKKRRGYKRKLDQDNDIDMNHNKKNVGGLSLNNEHLKWLENYKVNTMKANGEFVSIVHVFNFGCDAVKAMIKMIENQNQTNQSK